MNDVIVFRAYDSKRQNPVKLSPLEDASGRLFTGQGKYGYLELLSEEEKKTLPYIVTNDTILSLESGDVLDMKNPIDAINWEWVKKHPYVALDEEEGKSSRDAVLYVDNPERKAEVHVTKDKQITLAKAKIYAVSNSKKTLLAKALGNPGADSFSVNILEEWLIEKAELMPTIVTKYLEEKNKDSLAMLAFVEEIKLFSMLTRFAGTWKYGGRDGLILGTTEEEVVDFLLDKKNEENLFIIQEKLKEYKNMK